MADTENQPTDRPTLADLTARAMNSSATTPGWRTDYRAPRRERTHYLGDCMDANDGDALATTSEDYHLVDCQTCVAEMSAMGVL